MTHPNSLKFSMQTVKPFFILIRYWVTFLTKASKCPELTVFKLESLAKVVKLLFFHSLIEPNDYPNLLAVKNKLAWKGIAHCMLDLEGYFGKHEHMSSS